MLEMPDSLRFGGGVTETIIHPLVAVYLLIAIVLILTLPRGKSIIPFLFAFITIPIGQVVVLGGLHFTALRILILAGLVRVISCRKSSGGRFPGGLNTIDKLVMLWSVSALIVMSVQWMEKQALINALGSFLDTLGGYLVVRLFIPDGEAIRRTMKVLAAVCLINGLGMINEQFITHINVFGLPGGSGAVLVRDGHIRASGAMGCLYAGAFSGVLIPLFLWLWTERKYRVAACTGLAGATAMVLTSYSSTSYLSFGAGLVFLCCWPLRNSMRTIRLGLVTILVGLHLVMKAPVWALIARIDLTGSSSGDHRYHLVDNAIRHFSDWWLVGYRYYDRWGYDTWDLCNQFVAVALTGGLVSLIFYVAIFKSSFGSLGTVRKQVSGDRGQEWFLWCLGSSLFAVVVTHFGINYVPQLMVGFFSLVVCISVATREVSQAVPSSEVSAQEKFASQPIPSAAWFRQSQARREAKAGLAPGRKQRLAPWMKV